MTIDKEAQARLEANPELMAKIMEAIDNPGRAVKYVRRTQPLSMPETNEVIATWFEANDL